MSTFLRKNLMILVSIILPLLVVLLFALSTVLPGLYSTPPAHDLLLSLQGRSTTKDTQVKVRFLVRDQRLIAVATRLDKSSYDNNPRLYRYDHMSGEVREVDIPVPEEIPESSKRLEIPIAELAEPRVSEALKAPDGYEFRGRRRGGGLITELFGGSRNRTDVSIAKNGAVIRIRLPASDYWYNDVQFVAWVIE